MSALRGFSTIIVIVILASGGCEPRPIDYRYGTLNDGSEIEIIPLDSAQGRKDEARSKNEYIYRFRVTPRPNRPVLRCELEYYQDGRRSKVPVARLDYKANSTKSVDVTIVVKPTQSANPSAGKMTYFIRIADKQKTTTGAKIFAGLQIERTGARNLPSSFGDRWLLVAANHEGKKESWHNVPQDDDVALILHLAMLTKKTL